MHLMDLHCVESEVFVVCAQNKLGINFGCVVARKEMFSGVSPNLGGALLTVQADPERWLCRTRW